MSEETKQPSPDASGSETTAAKKPAAKKSAAKKPTAKKTTAKKPAARKAAPKKTGATATKTATSKASAEKTATTTSTQKASATRSAASKRATAAKRAAPAKPTTAKPSSKPAAPPQEANTANNDDTSTASDTGGPTATSPTQEKTESTSDKTERTHDPYTAENLAADFKEKDWKEVLVRAAFTVFYMFAGWIAIALGFAFTVVQFLIHLVTGHPNDVVKKAILCVGRYIGDIAAYVSFDKDERPFPFGKDLPDGD